MTTDLVSAGRLCNKCRQEPRLPRRRWCRRCRTDAERARRAARQTQKVSEIASRQGSPRPEPDAVAREMVGPTDSRYNTITPAAECVGRPIPREGVTRPTVSPQAGMQKPVTHDALTRAKRRRWTAFGAPGSTWTASPGRPTGAGAVPHPRRYPCAVIPGGAGGGTGMPACRRARRCVEAPAGGQVTVVKLCNTRSRLYHTGAREL